MIGAHRPPPTVYILDIDGTLIPTHEIDNHCYWEAVEEVFGRQDQSDQLLDYVHVSDSGILDQWCRQALGRGPSPEETAALRDRFLGLIHASHRQRPELFEPVPGLMDWLEEKRRDPLTHLAIATGSWGNTAAFKLQASGLSRFGLSLATADDAISRCDIMNVALDRLGLRRRPPPRSITYIGDGAWDLRASRELGWSFIGIAQGQRARSLVELGADRVHADFRPLVGTGLNLGN